MLQTVELTETPAKKDEVKSPTGFVLGSTQKTFLLVLVGGLLFLRLWKRKRRKDKVCSHCGFRNPPHRSNCTKCSSPLFGG